MNCLSVRLPDGSAADVRVVRRRQRRMILHMDRDNGSFWMSVPLRASDDAVWGFLLGKGTAWISAQRAEFRSKADRASIRCCGRECPLVWEAGPRRFEFADGVFRIAAPSCAEAEEMFRQWWCGEALACFERHVDDWMPLFSALAYVQRPLIRVRPLKRAWGICYRHPDRVHFSDRLFGVPDELVDYVVLHELTHLIFPDHGPAFKAFLTQRMPDWKKREQQLKGQSPLMSPLWPPQQRAQR